MESGRQALGLRVKWNDKGEESHCNFVPPGDRRRDSGTGGHSDVQ